MRIKIERQTKFRFSGALKVKWQFVCWDRWWNLCVSALHLQAPLTVTQCVTLQDTLDLLNKEGFDQVPVVGDSG